MGIPVSRSEHIILTLVVGPLGEPVLGSTVLLLSTNFGGNKQVLGASPRRGVCGGGRWRVPRPGPQCCPGGGRVQAGARGARPYLGTADATRPRSALVCTGPDWSRLVRTGPDWSRSVLPVPHGADRGETPTAQQGCFGVSAPPSAGDGRCRRSWGHPGGTGGTGSLPGCRCGARWEGKGNSGKVGEALE